MIFLSIPVVKVVSIVMDNRSNFVKAYKKLEVKVLKYTIKETDPQEASDSEEVR